MTRSSRSWPYLAPLGLVLAAWVYGPAVMTLVLSVIDWDLTSDPRGFVGLDHYAALFAHHEFLDAARNTVLYALVLLPFSTVVPMGLAIMLWMRPGRASGVYRSLLFVPVVLAPVAVATSWRFLLNPLQGLVNTVLEVAGLPGVNWLGDPRWALPTVVVVTAAKVVAFNMLLFGAALASLDRRLLEAARLEGASSWDATRHVVLPHLRPTAIALAALSALLAGQWVFTNVAELTAGGPDGSTDNVYYRIYTLAFGFFDTGEASAAAVVVLAAFVALCGLTSVARRRVDRARA